MLNPTGPSGVVVFIAPPQAVSVLRAVFAHVSADFPAAIVIVLHPGDGSERPVAANLNSNSSLLVMPGIAGTQLRNDHAYVVLPANNLVISGEGKLTPAAGSDAVHDAFLLGSPDDGGVIVTEIDALLSSLASRYGASAAAIALTALSESEKNGFLKVQASGGHTIALDETDRLWSDSSGPRVVPGPNDELLPTFLIGKRLGEFLALAKVPA